jgi:hypothetical protein
MKHFEIFKIHKTGLVLGLILVFTVLISPLNYANGIKLKGVPSSDKVTILETRMSYATIQEAINAIDAPARISAVKDAGPATIYHLEIKDGEYEEDVRIPSGLIIAFVSPAIRTGRLKAAVSRITIKGNVDISSGSSLLNHTSITIPDDKRIASKGTYGGDGTLKGQFENKGTISPSASIPSI